MSDDILSREGRDGGNVLCRVAVTASPSNGGSSVSCELPPSVVFVTTTSSLNRTRFFSAVFEGFEEGGVTMVALLFAWLAENGFGEIMVSKTTRHKC